MRRKQLKLFLLIMMLMIPFVRTLALDKVSSYKPAWAAAVTHDTDLWTKDAMNHEFKGAGTSSNPYLIEDAQDFAGLQYYSQHKTAKYMGSSSETIYYKLTADIDMANKRCTCIGDKEQGGWAYIYFDGGDHTIKNVIMPYDDQKYSENGIFGRLENSTIKNVTFENYYIGANHERQGLVGFMRTSTLENVHVKNGFVAGNDNLGGLVGAIGSDGSSTTDESSIINCSFEGKVHNRIGDTSNVDYFGGLVGYTKRQKLTIKGCLFRGSLSASNGLFKGRGGILGYQGENSTVTISSCAVLGEKKGDKYTCPLDDSGMTLTVDRTSNKDCNGYAVACMQYSSSTVNFTTPVYVGDDEKLDKITVCSGPKAQSNVYYLNAAYSNDDRGKYTKITDSRANTFALNYEGNSVGFSLDASGKIVVDLGHRTGRIKITSDKLPVEEISVNGKAEKSNTVYVQKGDAVSFKLEKSSNNAENCYYPTGLGITTRTLSVVNGKTTWVEKFSHRFDYTIDEQSLNGGYYVLNHSYESTSVALDYIVNTYALPIPTAVVPTLDSYNQKVTLSISRKAGTTTTGYYEIYRDGVYKGRVNANNSTISYTDNNVPVSTKSKTLAYEAYYVYNSDENDVIDHSHLLPSKTKFANLGASNTVESVLKNELFMTTNTTGLTEDEKQSNWVNVVLNYKKLKFYSGATYNIYVKGNSEPIGSGTLRTITSNSESTRYTASHKVQLLDNCTTYDVYATVDFSLQGNDLSQESDHGTVNVNGKHQLQRAEISKGDFDKYISLNIKSKKLTNTSSVQYVIERKLANASDDEYRRLQVINSTDPEITFNDEKVTPGNIYRYRVSIYSGCGGETGIVYNETADDVLQDYGFCRSLGSVSGRITYGGNNGVENVGVYISANNGENAHSQYNSIGFTGQLGALESEDIQGITFSDIEDIDNMYPYTLQFFMHPISYSDYGDNVASVPQVMLATIPSALETDSLKDYYRIAPLWKANGDYKDDANGDGSECYTDGITDLLPTGQFTAVFLQRQDATHFRLGYEKVVDGENTIVWKPFVANQNEMEPEYRGKITFARPTVDCAYSGWIDDIRLWNGEMSDADLLKYANRILSGTEPKLALYVNFDEGLDDYCFDISSSNKIRNGHHAAMYGATSNNTIIPAQEQLGLKGITDKNGNYLISGIPYSNEGTIYNVTPVYGTHEFNPSSQQLYINENSLVVNKTDFSDESSFPVKVAATYYGTQIPVEGAQILVDDIPVVKDGKIMTTGTDGLATVNVPIGTHKLKLSLQSHDFVADGQAVSVTDTTDVFDKTYAKGMITVPSGFDLDQTLTFVDRTLVRLVGRAVGGDVEASYGHGYGLSKNNIGQVAISLISTDGKNYSLNIFGDEARTVDNGNSKVKSTTEYYRDNIIITTDEKTGEYDALVPPVEFKTASISTVNGDDNTRLSTTSGDFTPVMIDAPLVEMTDSVVVDDAKLPYKYNAKNDFIYYAEPVINVTSADKDYPKMFGDTEFAYTGAGNFTDKIKLWSSDTDKLAAGGSDAYVLGYPVFTMGNKYTMNIEAYEPYINRDSEAEYRLPLDSVAFTITNQLSTMKAEQNADGTVNVSAADASVAEITLDKEGKASYKFMAGLPNYSDDHTLPLSMKTTIHGRQYVYPAEDAPTFRGIVMGATQVPGSDFVTAGPNLVDFVLRDPPGSNSYATLSEGSSISASHSFSSVGSGENQVGVKVSLGATTVTGVGYGSFILSETQVENEVNVGVSNEWELDDNDTWNVSYTTTRDISTSSSADYVGADGDVYIGSATNITIGETKNLGLVADASGSYTGKDGAKTYSLGVDTQVSTGIKYNTMFNYTQKHIQTSLIPNLYDLRKSLIPAENVVNSLANLPANNTTRPKYYALPTTDYQKTQWKRGEDYQVVLPANKAAVDTAEVYTNWILGWEKAIAYNEEIKAYCFDNLTEKKTHNFQLQSKYESDKGNLRSVSAEYGFLGNKSFDAGSVIDESTETTSEHEESYGYTAQFGVYGGTTIGGSFNEVGTQLEVSFDDKGGWSDSNSKTASSTRTMSYHLEDEDAGDYFSVDVYLPGAIYADQSNNQAAQESDVNATGKYANQTYVFRLKGGQSTCPYEGPTETQFYKPGTALDNGTIPVAQPQLVVENSNITNVANGKTAAYTVKLSSESSATVGAWYQLSYDETTNPDGLILTVDGQELAIPRLFYLEPGQTITKTVQAKQSKLGVLEYNGISLKFGSNCDDNVYKAVPLNISFVPASTDIELALSDITVNNGTPNGSVTLIASDYDRQFNKFGLIRLQYRRKGDTNWLNLYNFVNDADLLNDLNKMPAAEKRENLTSAKATYTWDLSGMTDGEYEVVAEAVSFNGMDEIKTVTDIQVLTIDRTAPSILGQPSPAGGILAADGEVAVTFNEDIQYNALTYNNFNIEAHLNNQEVGHTAALNFATGSEPASTEANITLNGDFTIEGWYKREAGKKGTILKHGDALELGVTADNKISLTVNGTNYQSTFVPMTNGQVDSDWQYFQLAYDSDTKDVTVSNLYGTETSDTKLRCITERLAEPYVNRARLYLGGNFNGQIHEVRMYNIKRGLTDAVADKDITLAGTEDNVTGYWQASEGHGTIATDKARNRNLTVNAGWYISEKNYAPHFDGTQYISVNVSSTPVSDKESMLMEFWFRGNKQSAASTLVGSKHYVEGHEGLYVGFDADNKLVLGSQGDKTVLSSNDYLDGNWHHFALNVLHGSTATAYVDGQSIKQISASAVSAIETDALILGANIFKHGNEENPRIFNYFTGAMDEFRLWRIRTTADVIRDRMYKRMNGDEAGLLAYYSFEGTRESAGVTVTESTLANKATVSQQQSGNATAVGAISFTDDTPALLSAEGQTSRYSAQWTANERKIVLTPDLPKYRMEGCTLTFTVQDVYDSHGNRQSDPIVWSAYVNQNRLTWSESVVELKQEVEQSTSFTVDITNGGNDTENWVLKNVPTWLSVSKESGTLKPLASERLTFTVSPATNIGTYDETIYLTGNDGMNSPLAISLKVTAERPDWAVNENKYASSMNIVGKLMFETEIAQDEDDIVAAFDGEECVGVASPIYVKAYDTYLLMMNVYGDKNKDNALKFKAWKASTGVVYPMVTIGDNTTTTMTYTVDAINGSLSAPTVFTAQDYVEQGIDLKQGWNWMSIYAKPDDATPDAIFADVTASYTTSENMAVKSKTDSWFFDGADGSGDGELSELNLTSMYMVNAAKAANLLITGKRVAPSADDAKISLNKGWNWIGMPLEGVCTIDRAFADAEPVEGDIVKSKTSFSVYDGSRWIGQLNYLTPGQGYEYKSAATTAKTFNYPTTYSTAMHAPRKAQGVENYWTSDDSPYHGNMTVVAQVYADGELLTNVELAAFSGAECRGSQISKENGRVFLTIAGDNNTTLTLNAYDHDSGVEYNGVGVIQYSDNAMLGTLSAPFVVNLTATGITSITNLDGDCEIYTLDGIRVNKAEKNRIYIIRDAKTGHTAKIKY